MAARIKFILSDLDGVIRMYPAERDAAIENKFGLHAGVIHKTAFEKNLLRKVILGQITDEAWRLETAKSLAGQFGMQSATMAIKEWSHFPGLLNVAYLEHLKSQFAGIPIALLTNGTSRLRVDLITLGIQDFFIKIFNSSEIGACKPDRKIYQHVIEQLGCRPSEIFFVDDSLMHVHAAQELGIVTHHYRSLELFKKRSL